MRKLILFSSILFIFFSLIQCNAVFAWDDKITHKDLSSYATTTSILSINNGDYLKKLGFNLGLDEVFEWGGKKQTVIKWIREGAELEDVFPRMLSHFHNPLKPWPLAGLWVWKSAIVWAQDGSAQENMNGGDWSWQKTRGYYYSALTSKLKTTRDAYFAKMFRGLGQQMHLLQDMAVPTHVRNDPHLLDPLVGTNGSVGKYFETWTKDNLKNLVDLKTFAPNPVETLTSLSSPTNYARITGYLPVALLSDSNTLTKETLAVPMNETLTGLAEWTNSNFFSDDTINLRYFGNSSAVFTYPSSTNTNLEKLIHQTLSPETNVAEDNVTDTSFYISKISAEGVEEVKHFAMAGYLTREFNNNIEGDSPRSKTFMLDDYCHEDYAKLLLPRAVGYSTVLIDHFFRGKINFVEADPNNKPGEYVIKNESEDETMNGTFSLYYDDKNDNRILLASWVTPTILPQGQYDPNPVSNPEHIPTFLVPDKNTVKEQGTYILAFQGTLGNESNAVVGRVIRSFREEWNNGMRGNHLWLTSGQEMKKADHCGQYSSDVLNGVLTKENTVVGDTACMFLSTNWTGLFHSLPCETKPNESCARVYSNGGCEDCFADEFGKEFPYPVTASTWIDIKVDEMSNTLTPDCNPADPNLFFLATQCIKYSFTDKNKKLYFITFAVDGKECGYFDDDDKYYYDITAAIQLHTNVADSIYTMLADLYKDLYKDIDPFKVFDPSEVEPFMLTEIKMIQIIDNPVCESSKQKMVVDYLRVEDR